MDTKHPKICETKTAEWSEAGKCLSSIMKNNVILKKFNYKK